MATSEEQRIQAWIEEHVGGKVVRLERQNRWRPVWFADVGTTLPSTSGCTVWSCTPPPTNRTSMFTGPAPSPSPKCTS